MVEIIVVAIAVGVLSLAVLHPPAAGPIKAIAVVVGLLFGIWRLLTRY